MRGRADSVSFKTLRSKGVRIAVPAVYAALLMLRVFGEEEGTSGTLALIALACFTLYLGWRLVDLARTEKVKSGTRGDGELKLTGILGVEIGFLSILALATLHQLLPILDPWWSTSHVILIAGLAAILRIPELIVLPICAVALAVGIEAAWEFKWLIALGHLEAVGLTVGLVFSVERAKLHRVTKSMERLRLEAEHLEIGPSAQTGSGKKGELTRLNEVLYNYLKEVKINTNAHCAVLAVRAAKGNLYVRELVSDSDKIREEAGLDLTGSSFAWILRNRKALSIASISEPGDVLGYYSGRVPAKSFMGVPVINGERVEGVLAIDSLEAGKFSDDTLSVLNVATHQASTLLSQITQLEQVRREARDFKCLHDLAKKLVDLGGSEELLTLVLNIVNERINPTFSAIVLLDEEENLKIEKVGTKRGEEFEGREFDAAQGLVGWALDSGQYLYYEKPRPSSRRPVFSDQVKLPEFQTLLIHPFSRKEQPLGALVVGLDTPMAMDTSSIAFCDILCQQIALGLLQIRTMDRLKAMATTDELTKLKNRRVFFSTAEEEIKRARRYVAPLSVIILDLDYFKKINDTYGHPAGDEVLRKLGALLAEHARDTDLPARIGGEEFAMLLPNTDEEGAKRMAERIRKAVAELKVVWEKRTLHMHISAGVAQVLDDETAEKMLERADQAMYCAKENGRNRVVPFSSVKEYLSWSA